MMLTEIHDSFQVCRSKLDHDRVGITVDDFSIVKTAIRDAEFGFNFLFTQPCKETQGSCC